MPNILETAYAGTQRLAHFTSLQQLPAARGPWRQVARILYAQLLQALACENAPQEAARIVLDYLDEGLQSIICGACRFSAERRGLQYIHSTLCENPLSLHHLRHSCQLVRAGLFEMRPEAAHAVHRDFRGMVYISLQVLLFAIQDIIKLIPVHQDP